MAHSLSAAPHWSFVELASAPFRAVVWFAESLSCAQGAVHTYDHLMSRSDRSLAQEGLTRADIARVAYERNFES